MKASWTVTSGWRGRGNYGSPTFGSGPSEGSTCANCRAFFSGGKTSCTVTGAPTGLSASSSCTSGSGGAAYPPTGVTASCATRYANGCTRPNTSGGGPRGGGGCCCATLSRSTPSGGRCASCA